jgi:hypothetical protein
MALGVFVYAYEEFSDLLWDNLVFFSYSIFDKAEGVAR